MYASSFLHLVNHAFFKALLFLSAGSVIHTMRNEQDLRRMGGAIVYLPMTYVSMLVASFSLSGVPFFTGCYSKDHILELAASQYTILSGFVFWVSSFTAFFTAAYSTRLIYLAMAGTPSGHHFLARKAITEVNRASTTQFYQLVNNSLFFILAAASLMIGMVLKDVFVGPANPF